MTAPIPAAGDAELIAEAYEHADEWDKRKAWRPEPQRILRRLADRLAAANARIDFLLEQNSKAGVRAEHE